MTNKRTVIERSCLHFGRARRIDAGFLQSSELAAHVLPATLLERQSIAES